MVNVNNMYNNNNIRRNNNNRRNSNNVVEFFNGNNNMNRVLQNKLYKLTANARAQSAYVNNYEAHAKELTKRIIKLENRLAKMENKMKNNKL